VPAADAAPHRSLPRQRPARPEIGDEAAYDAALAEVAAKRRRVVEMGANLARVTAELAQFELLCRAKVGHLLTDLQHAGEMIERYREEARRVRAALRGEPEPADPPEAPAFEAAADNAGIPDDDGNEEEPSDPASANGGDEPADVRRLYRDLARRSHPDLATDDADRLRRQERMLAINEAWARRDVAALRDLRHQIEADSPDFATRPLAERAAWANRELDRLDREISALRAEWLALRRTDLHKLWRRHEAGEEVFEELREQLENQLSREADRLDDAIATWRDLADEHPDLVGARPTAASL